MSAIRIIDDHIELQNIGSIPHSDIDATLLSGSFLVFDPEATGSAGSARVIQAGPGVSFDVSAEGVFKVSAQVGPTGGTFTGPVTAGAGLTGSLTQLTDGSPYLIQGAGISLLTGSNGSVTVSTAEEYLTLGRLAEPSTHVVFGGSLTGSLTKLATGGDFLRAGSNVLLSTGSDGSVTIAANIPGFSSGVSNLEDGTPIPTGSSGSAGSSQFTALRVNALTGSLTQLYDGSPYLRAGPFISLVTGSDGSVTISNTLRPEDLPLVVGGRQRVSYEFASFLPSGSVYSVPEFNFNRVSYASNLIDVIMNGQLLHTGSMSQVTTKDADYCLTGPSEIIFSFDVTPDDVLDIIMQGGESAPAAVQVAPVVTYGTSSDFPNSRQLKAGAGVSITTSPAGYVTIASDATLFRELVLNETPIGAIDGINPDFTLHSAPAMPESTMVWLNGQLLTNGTDYNISGDKIAFLGNYMPRPGDQLKTMYSRLFNQRLYAVNEPVGSYEIDGETKFELDYVPRPTSSLMLFFNGQLLTQGASSDYVLDGRTITPTFEIEPNDVVRATYAYDP